MNLENENIDPDMIQDFDDLYNGVLSEEQYYILKDKLQKDKVLREQYLIYKMLRNEIEKDGIANKVIKARFAKLDKKKRAQKQLFRVFAASLSVIVILGVLWFNFKEDGNTKDSLYELYKDTEPGLPIRMNKEESEKLNLVMVEISKKNYEEALIQLTKMPANDTSNYFKGFCLEMKGSFAEAESIYLQLKSASSIYIKEKADFRHALLQLESEKNTAQELFNLIAADSTHAFSRLAKEINSHISKK